MDNTNPVADKDAFAKHVGIEIVEIGAGTAKARLETGPQHLNGYNMVHGGVIFTLADYAFAVACNSHDPPSVAVNANISYIKAASGGQLLAAAQEVQQEGRLGTCLVRVTDADGDVVAMFQGLSYRKGPGGRQG